MTDRETLEKVFEILNAGVQQLACRVEVSRETMEDAVVGSDACVAEAQAGALHAVLSEAAQRAELTQLPDSLLTGDYVAMVTLSVVQRATMEQLRPLFEEAGLLSREDELKTLH